MSANTRRPIRFIGPPATEPLPAFGDSGLPLSAEPDPA
jgi:hypothetical protein